MNFLKDIIRNLKRMPFQAYLLFLYLSILFVLTVARYILHNVFALDDGALRTIILTILSAVPMILFIFNRKKFNTSVCKTFYMIYSVLLIIIALTAWLKPEMHYFFFREGYGLERVLRFDGAIYAFLFFSLLDNAVDIFTTIHVFSYFNFLYLLIVEWLPAFLRGFWYNVAPDGSPLTLTYNLSFGYAMVFPTLVFAYNAARNNNKLDALLSLFGFILIFNNGNRGALLLTFVFVAIMGMSFFMEAKTGKSKINVFSKVVAVYVVMGVLMRFIIPAIPGFIAGGIDMIASNNQTHTQKNEIVEKMENVHRSRNLRFMEQGKFTNNNGRFAIWESVIKGTKSAGILGNGFYGDRPFCFQNHYVAYSHNIFIELLASFGFFGLIFSLWLIYACFKMLFFCKDRDWRDLFIIFFVISCQLLISLSLWYVWEFWADRKSVV